jgi:hypothetical protein
MGAITAIMVLLVITPWSLIIGVSYLAYRRIRSQRAMRKAFEQRVAEGREVLKNAVKQSPLEGWKTADADYISKMGRA